MTEERRAKAKAYTADEITVYFDSARCRHFAECVRGLPGVFDTAQRPWIRAGNAAAPAIAEVVRRCPTGALHYALTDGPDEEPERPTRVVPLAGGPVLVRGDLAITTPDGELRETRAALCACGAASAVAPFCDGTCGVNARPST